MFVGPADLAADMGQLFPPRVVAAIEQAAMRIRAAGVVTFDPARIPRLVGLGFTFLGVGGGIASYAKAIRALAKEADAART
jgi:2-keto-3-deoxy-L-rhamnonate aldolase RhmA